MFGRKKKANETDDDILEIKFRNKTIKPMSVSTLMIEKLSSGNLTFLNSENETRDNLGIVDERGYVNLIIQGAIKRFYVDERKTYVIGRVNENKVNKQIIQLVEV